MAPQVQLYATLLWDNVYTRFEGVAPAPYHNYPCASTHEAGAASHSGHKRLGMRRAMAARQASLSGRPRFDEMVRPRATKMVQLSGPTTPGCGEEVRFL
jgi:hypothetical protein